MTASIKECEKENITMMKKFRLFPIMAALLFCAVAVFFATSSTAQAAALPGPGGFPPPPPRARVCPAPPSFGGRDNARDHRIQELQQELARRGYKDSHGRLLRVSGVFDQDTQNAVRRFESDHRLRIDGVPGSSVWRQLNVCQ